MTETLYPCRDAQSITQTPQCSPNALWVEFSHLLGRHLARHMRQDVDHRRPVSGRFVQRDTQATKDRLVAVRIHHTHALLRDLTRWRTTIRAQGSYNLTREPLMFASHAEGAALVDLTPKGAGTAIAVCN